MLALALVGIVGAVVCYMRLKRFIEEKTKKSFVSGQEQKLNLFMLLVWSVTFLLFIELSLLVSTGVYDDYMDYIQRREELRTNDITRRVFEKIDMSSPRRDEESEKEK